VRQAERDLAQSVGVFCPGGDRPPLEAMTTFIDEHREAYGVEPICKVLPIAPSTYYQKKAQESEPEKRATRAQRDEQLSARLQRVWEENFQSAIPGRTSQRFMGVGLYLCLDLARIRLCGLCP